MLQLLGQLSGVLSSRGWGGGFRLLRQRWRRSASAFSGEEGGASGPGDEGWPPALSALALTTHAGAAVRGSHAAPGLLLVAIGVGWAAASRLKRCCRDSLLAARGAAACHGWRSASHQRSAL